MKNSFVLAAFAFTIVVAEIGRAEAGNVYNGPLTPNPQLSINTYDGYSIYYYTGTFSNFLTALNTTNTLVGVPDRYKYLPWHGDSFTAQDFAYDWSNGDSFGSGGTRFPNPGNLTPFFAYAWDSNVGYATGDFVTTSIGSTSLDSTYSWAVAVSQ